MDADDADADDAHLLPSWMTTQPAASFRAQLDARLQRERCPPARFQTTPAPPFFAAVWLDAGLDLPGAIPKHIALFASFDHVRHHIAHQTYTHIALFAPAQIQEATSALDAEERAAYAALQTLPPSSSSSSGGTAATKKKRAATAAATSAKKKKKRAATTAAATAKKKKRAAAAAAATAKKKKKKKQQQQQQQQRRTEL